MPRRRPKSRAQQVAPKGFPGRDTRWRKDPLLPSWPPCDLRSEWRSGGSRASGGSAEWWQESSGESLPTKPGVDVRCPSPCVPFLPTVAPRAARNRTGLRSLLSPPVLLAGAPQTPARARPRPGVWEDFSRGSMEGEDSLGPGLAEFLPTRFREFLHKLGVQWVEQPQPPTSSESHQRGVSEPWWGHSAQCSSCSFLPDLRCQSSNSQNSFKKVLLHQVPTLGPLRKDHTQFTKVKKANNPHGLQAPKLKASLTHSSSGEGSGHCRRYCPFRVRFADETLQDTVLRYWERSCALQQGITESSQATQPAAPERVFGSIRRWLENLPSALNSRTKEEATASSPSSWDRPSLLIPELQRPLSENICMNSRQPFTPRATTQRQQRDHKTVLGSHSILDQVGKSPSALSQKLESVLPLLELHMVLNRGRPRESQLLWPSLIQQQAQR
uniref:DUF4685 domain-containing protein n=2 Tax=Molossus molossus TaxID=27622 RepID=A0A7J8ECG2_MOLMO|nr:hypothetical protein HJG59_001957 [Molossus molossus]